MGSQFFKKKSYKLATVKVRDETTIKEYTYNEDPQSKGSVCEDVNPNDNSRWIRGQTDGNINLDYFIKNQAPYKIDDILPKPEILANLTEDPPNFIVTKVILPIDPWAGLGSNETCTYNNYTVKYDD